MLPRDDDDYDLSTGAKAEELDLSWGWGGSLWTLRIWGGWNQTALEGLVSPSLHPHPRTRIYLFALQGPVSGLFLYKASRVLLSVSSSQIWALPGSAETWNLQRVTYDIACLIIICVCVCVCVHAHTQ